MKRIVIKIICLAFAPIFYSVACAQNSNCGTERWSIKVLKDPDTTSIDFRTIESSIAQQTQLPKVVTTGSDTRLPSEKNLYSVSALITEYKLETDGDIHLVIHDPVTDSAMIAEIPNPDCPTLQGTNHVEQYRIAQKWINDSIGAPKTSFSIIDPPRLVRLEGVGYYDPFHGQTGVAANNRELHPVLGVSDASEQSVSMNSAQIVFCIYPNPSKTFINIYSIVPDGEKIVGLKIVDVEGVEKYYGSFNTISLMEKIKLSTFSSGLYIARLITKTRAIDRSFVVEK